MLELLDDPHTDVISALERKVDSSPVSFAEDSRVTDAVHILRNTAYDLSTSFDNMYDHLCFKDDTWLLAYLLDCVGERKAAADARHEYLQGYDPFNAINPVTKGFAYCEALEIADSIPDLRGVYDSMRYHVGQSSDPVLERMYPVLLRVCKMQKEYIHKNDSVELQLVRRISRFIDKGDRHAESWDLSDAAQSYKQAADLACQLHDDVLADMIYTRLKGFDGDMPQEVEYFRSAIKRYGHDSERGQLYDKMLRGMTHVLPKKA
ncbi:MAG: hypothetical protein V1729_04590 [Candidatus Woesearchaeota archaeon]